MALKNEILTGRHNRFLQKLFGIKGGPPSPQLSSEIQPVHPLFHGAENRYIEGWDRFGNLMFQGAVAAQTSSIRMRNPLGSNVIAVFEKIQVTLGTGDTPKLFIGATGIDLATTILTEQVIDPRTTRAGSSLKFSSTTNPAAFGGAIGLFGITAINQMGEFILTHDQEIPVLPGNALSIVTVAVNTFLNVGVIWRERALEETERF